MGRYGSRLGRSGLRPPPLPLLSPPSLWPAALPASFLGVFECPQLEPLIILQLTPPPPLGPLQTPM